MADATQAPPVAGTFCWNELMTSSIDGARDFYAKLFGWTYDEMDMGPVGKYAPRVLLSGPEGRVNLGLLTDGAVDDSRVFICPLIA